MPVLAKEASEEIGPLLAGTEPAFNEVGEVIDAARAAMLVRPRFIQRQTPSAGLRSGA